MNNEDAERIERHRRRGDLAAQQLDAELREDRRQHLLNQGATPDQAQQGSVSSTACREVQSLLTQKG